MWWLFSGLASGAEVPVQVGPFQVWRSEPPETTLALDGEALLTFWTWAPLEEAVAPVAGAPIWLVTAQEGESCPTLVRAVCLGAGAPRVSEPFGHCGEASRVRGGRSVRVRFPGMREEGGVHRPPTRVTVSEACELRIRSRGSRPGRG